LKLEHISFTAVLIRDQIEEVDAAILRNQVMGDDEMERNAPEGTQEHTNLSVSEPPVVDNSSHQGRKATFEAGAITLRSRQQPPLALSYLESLSDQGHIFRNFRKRLSDWLTSMFPLYDISFPLGCTHVKFEGSDKVSTAFGYRVFSS